MAARYVNGYRVTHTMADGTHRDSVEGLTIPTTGPTEAFYKILEGYEEQHPEESAAPEEDKESK